MSENKNEVKELTTEHLAMEVLKQEQEKSKAGVIGRNIAIVSLAIVSVIIAIGMAIINYRNDCDWRKMFNSYDFISQDGEGYNNVNSGQQGDVSNGAKSEAEKEQGKR